jgi:FkbM family methyltransferase
MGTAEYTTRRLEILTVPFDQKRSMSKSWECWPASPRDSIISHVGIRFGRFDRFRAFASTRKRILSVVARRDLAVQYETAYGIQILLPAWDTNTVIAAIYGRITHPWITKIFREVIQPGYTVIDGGANVGFYSVLAASLMRGHGRVVSFEPDPRNIPLLQANAVLNYLTDIIHLEPKALSNVEDELDFWVCPENSLFGSLVELKGSQDTHLKVPGTTLDLYQRSAGIGNIDVIKLDIEGAEPLALQGMRRGLETAKLLIFEINKPRLVELGIMLLDLINQTVEWGHFTSTLISDERTDEVLWMDDSRCPEILDEYGWANVICGKGEVADRLSGILTK